MSIFSVISATTKTDCQNDKFTIEALNQMALMAKGAKIIDETSKGQKQVGEVLSGKVVNDKLHLNIEVLDIANGYIVPCFVVSDCEIKDNVRAIKELSYLHFGLVVDPVDQHLTAMRRVYSEK